MTWLDRAVVLSLALLLSLQLLMSGQHKDNHPLAADNCASCVFAHHMPSGLPEVTPVLVPVRTAQSYRIEAVAFHEAPSTTSFLIPKSQAPPRA